MDVNIIKLGHFFHVDTAIKKRIFEASPFEIKYEDEESMIEYTNELYELLLYIFCELKCVSLDLFGRDSAVLLKINYLEDVIKNSFYSCGLNIDKLKAFYKKYISDMSNDFVNSVKTECVGYTLGGTSCIDSANSVNELLHFIHSYTINNDTILQSIPQLGAKQNEYGYSVCLRGASSTIFNNLYQQFPLDINVGQTDMVAIDEKKMIMMVRDRGHALSIEITINRNLARIEYFIPKLCNIEMINQLPGILNKVNNDSIGATGVMEVPVENLAISLFDFISKVPMDSDMISYQIYNSI